MAVKIRLKRLGKIRAPYYRVVVADSRTKRDGRAIEEIGKYHPTEEPSLIQINSERAQYWLGVGAQPSEQVLALLKITGDWQKYKGLPGTEGTLRVSERTADARAAVQAADDEAERRKAENAQAKADADAAAAKEKADADAAAAKEKAEADAAAATEEPAPETADEPAADAAEEPAPDAAEEPAEATAEEPAEATAEEPAAATAEEPAAETADAATEAK